MSGARPGSEGKPRLAVAAVAFAAMAALGAYSPSATAPSSQGVCFPNPALWIADPAASAVTSAAITLCMAFALLMANKEYIFLRTNDTLYASLFLLATGAQPALAARFGAGTLIAAAALVAFVLLLSRSGRGSSPTTVFLIFAMISFGSTVCWDFVVLALLAAFCTFFFGLLDWRGAAAMLLGVVTPYWLLIAFGAIDASSFNAPPPTSFQTEMTIPQPLFIALLGYGVTALSATLCALGSLMRIFSQNARLRASSYSIITLAAGSAVMIAVNPAHAAAWGGLLALCSGVITAQAVSFARARIAGGVFALALAAYATIFIFSVYV